MRVPVRRTTSLPAAVLAAAVLSGCAGARFSAAGPAALALAPERCRVASGRNDPLVTGWSGSEKANLEALLRGGAVAVEYGGCTMRVLTACRVGGRYAWQRTTPSKDVLEIDGEDSLYAKLPLGAASLEAELKRSGKLAVHTYASGQLRLEGASARDVPPHGECARATHVVGALSVGAFSLEASGRASAGADASLARASLGGKTERGAGVVRSAGSWEACDESTDGAPHANCRSPLQVFLSPIPGRAPELGPPGRVKVDLVSAQANSRWDVYYDDEVICSTPCTRWLDPGRPLLLQARGVGPMRGDRVVVRDLLDLEPAGAGQVQAHATSYGKLATGITFTTFGGMAVITGVTLASIGCSDLDARGGMCKAGATSFAAGAFVTAGAVWLILDALPKVDVFPGGDAAPGTGRRFALTVGPGVVSGRF
jgi:hypothetical protein